MPVVFILGVGVNRKSCRIGLQVPVLPVRVLPAPVLPERVAKRSRHPLVPVPVLPVRVLRMTVPVGFYPGGHNGRVTT